MKLLLLFFRKLSKGSLISTPTPRYMSIFSLTSPPETGSTIPCSLAPRPCPPQPAMKRVMEDVYKKYVITTIITGFLKGFSQCFQHYYPWSLSHLIHSFNHHSSLGSKQPMQQISGIQLPVEKTKRKIFKGTTQVRSEAGELPQDMIPTLVPQKMFKFIMLLGAFLACTRLILHDCSCTLLMPGIYQAKKRFLFFLHVKKPNKTRNSAETRKSCMPEICATKLHQSTISALTGTHSPMGGEKQLQFNKCYDWDFNPGC